MKHSRSIKFARALVVASGLAALGTLGCGRDGVTRPPEDAGTPLADAGLADAGPGDAGPFSCTQCDCFVDAGRPSCEAIMHAECCFAVGPLPPPDLPAFV